MDDLARRAAALRPRLDPGWQPDEVEHALEVLHRRRHRRRRRLVGAVGLGIAAAALLLTLGLHGSPDEVRQGAELPAIRGESVAAAPGLELGDGARVEPFDADSEVVATAVARDEVAVRLVRGGARFDVAPSPRRRFEVAAGDLAITSHSATFAAYRSEGALIVEVSRGELVVSWPGGNQAMVAGDRTRFPPAAAQQRAPLAGVAAPTARRHTERSRSWRVLAERGEFEAAHRLIAAGASLIEMEDLLLVADIARLSHHPADAVTALRRALDRHGGDPREAIAAFTLGRVLLDELGSPSEAAAAFARARATAPDGALAEDSLAREVEGWSRAGEREEAERSARAYLERYPDGRRVEAVRRHGGLE